jgi:hypothetical protein
MIISWVMMLTGIGKIIDEEPMILVPEGSGKRWKLLFSKYLVATGWKEYRAQQ